VLDAWQPYYVNSRATIRSTAAWLPRTWGRCCARRTWCFSSKPWRRGIRRRRSRAAHPGRRLGEDPLHSNLPFLGISTDLIVAGELDASLAALVEQLKKVVPSSSRKASRALARPA